MKQVLAPMTFTLLGIILLTLLPLGCSLKESGPQTPTVTSAKTQETLFTVIETEDPEYPTLAASIRLPFRVTPDNTVVHLEKHAYLTTERHLHVIDLAIPQRPVYLTSLEFAKDIGKVLALSPYVVVATRKTLHIVDVSQPSSPVLHSTAQLPERHAIKDFAAHDGHLYVIGENDSLYEFYIDIDFGQARLRSTVKLEKHWWLLSPKGGEATVEQIPHSTSDPPSQDIPASLFSQQGFLQFRSSRQDKVRASSEFLGVEDVRDPRWDLRVFYADIIGVGMSVHHMDRNCWRHLTTIEEKRLTRRKPTLAYRVGALGEMQPIATTPLSETIDIDVRRFMGPVTDFQFSGVQLSVVTAKGFFVILTHRIIEHAKEHKCHQLLSVTPLQASRPISIAMEQDYVSVLAATGDSDR